MTWRRRSLYTNAKFRPYTRAIGEFALAWNDFHEALGDLFVKAVAGEVATKQLWLQANAIWGAITNDRQKRAVLESAINLIGAERHRAAPNIADDVIWLIKRGDGLEDRRNNVIHSPLIEQKNALSAALLKQEYGSIVPYGTFHERGSKLSAALRTNGRDLLAEIRMYRDYATVLAMHARNLSAVWGTRRAWPKQPKLPSLKNRG